MDTNNNVNKVDDNQRVRRMRREMALGIGDGKEKVRWTFSGSFQRSDYRRHCTVNEDEEGAFAFVEGREGLGEGVPLVDPLS